jgi:glycosyltransferase involved in cell wall biosynthesis
MTDNPKPAPELLVVLPVYNESESIGHVLGGWLGELDKSGCDYKILSIDDGSTDNTREILEAWAAERPERMEVRSRENRGHGRSCLEGYREAVVRGVPYVLQIDSDGQSLPEFFGAFWNLREQYEVIYGIRARSDGWQRKVASLILRISLRVFEGVDCVDANVPYRLMRSEACAPTLLRIPEDISLANVALSVMLRREDGIRHGAVPIGFPPRYGGEPSVPLRRFLAKAVELFRQLRTLREPNPTKP